MVISQVYIQLSIYHNTAGEKLCVSCKGGWLHTATTDFSDELDSWNVTTRLWVP
jgi:hypothetical protein